MQKTDLQGVQGPSDALRAHWMTAQGQPVAQVLQAAEGHVAEGDVGPDAGFTPMEDRTDLEIVLVGPKAGFDGGQLAILTDQGSRVGRVATPNHDAAQPISARGGSHLVRVPLHRAVGEVQKAGQPDPELRDLTCAVVGILARPAGRMGHNQPSVVIDV